MSKFGEELVRTSANRKTFFFNRQKATNGQEYLCINTMWGSGNREKLVMFPDQVLAFKKAFDQAFKKFTGLTPAELEVPDPEWPQLPSECPQCGADELSYRVMVLEDRWEISCEECYETIFSTPED